MGINNSCGSAISRSKKKFLGMATMVGILVMVAGCASKKFIPTSPQDPYENFNRRVFAFNMAVDRAFMRPIARVYDYILPWPAKQGAGNFFANIGSTSIVANELLQLHFSQAVAEMARIVINTTVGIGGLFDVASRLGLEQDTEDFGLTLGVWGSRDTPYLVLPFLGPSTLRDAVGTPVDYLLFSIWPHIKSNTLRYSLTAGNLLQRRAKLLAGDEVIDQSFDPYIFMRDAYLQRRDYLVRESKEEHVVHYEDEKGVIHRSRRSIPARSVISD